jgi:hypothetical protein
MMEKGLKERNNGRLEVLSRDCKKAAPTLQLYCSSELLLLIYVGLVKVPEIELRNENNILNFCSLICVGVMVNVVIGLCGIG